jgi:hypothetical protein
MATYYEGIMIELGILATFLRRDSIVFQTSG